MEVTISFGCITNDDLHLTVWPDNNDPERATVSHTQKHGEYNDLITYSDRLDLALLTEKLRYRMGNGELHYELSEEQIKYLTAVRKLIVDGTFKYQYTMEV